MTSIHLLPGDDAGNGWLNILPPRADCPPLRGSLAADWLVVGAGFSGLAAARRLAERRPHERVVLLEAQAVGEGASGRNSGFAIDVPHLGSHAPDMLAAARRHLALARFAVAELEGLVERHAIDCGWRRRGHYHAAVSAASAERDLGPYAAELAALGEPFRRVEAAELERNLGTRHFAGAVWTPGTRLMNPAALVRGLAASLPDNVLLCERSPVVALRRGSAIEAETPQGLVRAPRLILGTDAFSEAFGVWRRRIFGIGLYASLTRPLSEAERARMGEEEDWGLTPADGKGVGMTLRFTRDRRLLLRERIVGAGSFRRSDADRAAAARHHARLMGERWPGLAGVPVEHSWIGYVGLSVNRAPGFGRVADDVWTAVCHNSVGVTRGTYSGILAADLAMGEDNPLVAELQALGTPARRPPRPFVDLGVAASLAWKRWRHRAEA